MIDLRTVGRTPLIHFLAIGAIIFVAFDILDDAPAAPSPEDIVLTPVEAQRLAQQFAATWNRSPSVEELEGLMQSWALEEATVREALALGLDRGDAVIRQRLVLKMRFLAEAGGAAQPPDDATLQSHLDANAKRFAQPARYGFEQILMPQDVTAAQLRAMLEDGADPATLGAASLMPTTVDLTPAPLIGRAFGETFQAALADLSIGSWQGPIASSYGRHLVRLTGAADADLPPLAAIRDRVEADWRAAKAQDARDSFSRSLLARHAVALPDAREVLDQ